MAEPNQQTLTPSLQAPGAGLPWWELFVARRWVFPRACRRLTWETAGQLFRDEGAKILAIWDTIPTARLNERVLIRRLRGMEDSSRFWSAAMTVEHLNIVASGIRLAILGLRRGSAPNREVRTQDVKPKGEMPPEEVKAKFTRMLADTAGADATETPIPPGEGPKFPHPWFGPLDAFHWRCLLGVHQQIHRKQIEAIRDGLNTAKFK